MLCLCKKLEVDSWYINFDIVWNREQYRTKQSFLVEKDGRDTYQKPAQKQKKRNKETQNMKRNPPSLLGDDWRTNDESIVELCKTIHGRAAELETLIHCLFNVKDQRFSNWTGVGSRVLDLKHRGERLIHMDIYPYDINLSTGICCRSLWMLKAYAASRLICISSWKGNPLKAAPEFRVITSGTGSPQHILESAGGKCHTYFFCSYSLSRLWPTLSNNILH